MGDYVVEVNATSNTGTNTEDTFVEIDAFHEIVRVEVREGDGTETSITERNFRVRVVTKTALGATGTGGTENKLGHGDDRASGIATLVKNGATAFSVGTIGEVKDTGVVNNREKYVWQPPVPYTTTKALADGRATGVLIQSPTASVKFQVKVWYRD